MPARVITEGRQGCLCAILLFAGIGSRNAPLMLRWLREKGLSHAYILSVGIAFMVLLNLLASTLLMQLGVGLPAIVRVVVVTALIAPLAILLYLSAASAFHGIVGNPKETGLLSD